MKRAVIIVKGEVQRVGYRDGVERIARRLDVKGFIENLKGHDVRIICEGSDDAVRQLIEQIQIKRYPVFVEKIDVNYEKPTGEFEYFEIKRGIWQDELAERFNVAVRMLYSMDDRQRSMLEKQDKTIGTIGEGDEKISKEIRDGNEKIIGKQDVMIEKQDQMLEKQDIMIGKQDDNTAVLKSFAEETNRNFLDRLIPNTM